MTGSKWQRITDDFRASLSEVALTHAHRREAERLLERARVKVRAAAGRSPAVRELARLELDRAIVIAEEWGVVGRRGRL